MIAIDVERSSDEDRNYQYWRSAIVELIPLTPKEVNEEGASEEGEDRG